MDDVVVVVVVVVVVEERNKTMPSIDGAAEHGELEQTLCLRRPCP